MESLSTLINQDNNLVDSVKLPDQPERLEWLPPGWLMETKIRYKGESIGHKDKYYIDPETGRRFRSKREVQEYVKNGGAQGTEGRPYKRLKTNKKDTAKTMPSKSSEAIPPINFDDDEPPEKVRWVLGNSTGDLWIPFIGEQRVPENIRLQWATMYNPLFSKSGDSKS
ncbi:methyl-CpG-binding domain-containing protein [Thalictrum thalictroides]|uniref:Methyl-CpG-binding domain-containing protein n=1 Tax=Thalictrum thalictroides TaxID=46969 RepID=A0A7J6V0U4_THATH|nr:methyl-CpG-binding domain-containing protein [Thalictrum thalictroides]